MSTDSGQTDSHADVPLNDFDELFAAHYSRLVRALSVVAGDSDAAADAVQEAFVKAHVRWSRIGHYDDPIGWVRRVALNRVHDEYRRSKRQRSLIARLRARSEDAVEPPVFDEVDRLLAALPRQQRAVTAFRYVDGLTVAEIARTLEISEGTVKSQLHDARRRLRTVVEAPVDQPSPWQENSHE